MVETGIPSSDLPGDIDDRLDLVKVQIAELFALNRRSTR